MRKICDSNKIVWIIAILSVIVGMSIALHYAEYIDDVPESVSYSNNFSVPSESILKEFSDIRIEIAEDGSDLIYGKGGIPIAFKTLNPEEFEIQEFSKYYYTIQNNNASGFAKVELTLCGISGRDAYQTFYAYDAGRIIAEENSFGPLDFGTIKPEYDIVNFEFKKIGEIINFTINFEHNSKSTWNEAVIGNFVIFSVLIFFIIVILDIILFMSLGVIIFIAEYNKYRNRNDKQAEE
ncbi:MAG: hypothetical protein KAQ87_03810 [Candidatus Pacebacteria bacterium]|nr:hypothetical protein [Candidatus Paceibacterota bacterium]